MTRPKKTHQDENNVKIKNCSILLKLMSTEETWMRVCSCIKYNGLTKNDWVNFCLNNNLNMDEEKHKILT
jgi:hypothetical protein